MSDRGPRYYTRDEWEAMSEHDRDVVRDYRRREVERAAEEHEERQRMLDALTVERFGQEGK